MLERMRLYHAEFPQQDAFVLNNASGRRGCGRRAVKRAGKNAPARLVSRIGFNTGTPDSFWLG